MSNSLRPWILFPALAVSGGCAGAGMAPAEAPAPVEAAAPAGPEPDSTARPEPDSALEARLVALARATRGPGDSVLPIKPAGISWSPEPEEGSAVGFTIHVRPSARAPVAVNGEFAGRPVRFAPLGNRWFGLAAVPIGDAGPGTLSVRLEYEDGSTSEQTVEIDERADGSDVGPRAELASSAAPTSTAPDAAGRDAASDWPESSRDTAVTAGANGRGAASGPADRGGQPNAAPTDTLAVTSPAGGAGSSGAVGDAGGGTAPPVPPEPRPSTPPTPPDQGSTPDAAPKGEVPTRDPAASPTHETPRPAPGAPPSTGAPSPVPG